MFAGADREASARGHGVAGVDDQVHDDLLDLAGIDFHDVPGTGSRTVSQLDVRADQPPEHLFDLDHVSIEVEHDRGQDLLAAEREELPGQAGGAVRRLCEFAASVRGFGSAAAMLPRSSSR